MFAGIFDSDASILASDLVWLLSEKTVGDYSWIRPGKVLWDWWNNNNIYGVDFKAGINTETYMYMVDYAARHGAYVGAAVSANLRLVVQTSERYASELASEGRGHRTPERRFTHSRGP